MSKQSGRVGQWVLPAAVCLLGMTVLWTVCTLLVMAVADNEAKSFLATLAAVLGVLAVAAGSATVAGAVYMLLAIYQHHVQAAGRTELEQAVRSQGEFLEKLGDGLMFSDRAKAVAFREKERDALRHAIQEELAKQDWEAAYHLIDEMQRSFGYRAEADRLRDEVDQRKHDTVLASMTADMAMFRELVNNCNWIAARAEAERLAAQYPDQPETRALPADVEDAREAYKRRLLSEFKQAIDRSEFDRGVSLLKELDQYLTPGEAAGLQEAARGVFRGKLHNLGVQFSIAISGKNWAEALSIGEQIVGEFPNSRMAVEVRDNLDALRKRAAEAAGK